MRDGVGFIKRIGRHFVVANAASNGIEILPFPYGTPGWAGVDCKGLDEHDCEAVPPLSGSAKAAWTGFLATLVGRYGPGGTFWSDQSDAYDPPYVPITQWQIWNEPSSITYYRPKPKPKGYAKLVKLSHDAIRSVDPNAQIVLAGVRVEARRGDLVRVSRPRHRL